MATVGEEGRWAGVAGGRAGGEGLTVWMRNTESTQGMKGDLGMRGGGGGGECVSMGTIRRREEELRMRGGGNTRTLHRRHLGSNTVAPHFVGFGLSLFPPMVDAPVAPWAYCEGIRPSLRFGGDFVVKKPIDNTPPASSELLQSFANQPAFAIVCVVDIQTSLLLVRLLTTRLDYQTPYLKPRARRSTYVLGFGHIDTL